MRVVYKLVLAVASVSAVWWPWPRPAANGSGGEGHAERGIPGRAARERGPASAQRESRSLARVYRRSGRERARVRACDDDRRASPGRERPGARPCTHTRGEERERERERARARPPRLRRARKRCQSSRMRALVSIFRVERRREGTHNTRRFFRHSGGPLSPLGPVGLSIIAARSSRNIDATE